MEMLTSSTSKEEAAAIVRKNPALLALSTATLEDRINRCPPDKNISTWLLPSKKGRRKVIHQPTKLEGDPILLSDDENASFDSLAKIYPNAQLAARDLGMTESSNRTCQR